MSAITKPDPNSEFLNPFASRHHQLFWLNVTHSSLWWSHHVLLIEIRNVDFAISSLYYQSSPIVGTSSTFSISLGATTFQFFTHFKMICTKFPRPSCYFSVYEFNEYDRGNYEICFYIRAGIFGTSLKQLYFAAIPYLPTRDSRGSPQWRQDAQVYRVPKVIGQAGNLKRHMVIHSKERHRLCPVLQVFWPSWTSKTHLFTHSAQWYRC